MHFKIYSLTVILLFFSYSTSAEKNNSPMANKCEQWCRARNIFKEVQSHYEQAVAEKKGPGNSCNPNDENSMLAQVRNDCFEFCGNENEVMALKMNVEYCCQGIACVIAPLQAPAANKPK